MNTARETIYDALYQKLKNGLLTPAGPFSLVSRRLQPWSEISPEQQPALFQVQKGEDVMVTGRGMPQKYRLSINLEVYAFNPASNEDPQAPASSVINPLLDSIEAFFAPDPATGVQTLQIANVSHCWIEGGIEIFEGDLNAQIMAVVPVNILTV